MGDVMLSECQAGRLHNNHGREKGPRIGEMGNTYLKSESCLAE